MRKKKIAKTKTTRYSTTSWILLMVVTIIFLSVVMTNRYSPPPPYMMDNMSGSVQYIPFNFANQKITLNNQELTFVNGTYAVSDTTNGQHSAMMMNRSISPSKTRAAAILMDNPGGSGAFYYIVGASLINGKEVYATPIFLGDKIKIQSVTVDNPGARDNGIITIQYLTRPASSTLDSSLNQQVTANYAFQNDGNLTHVLY